MSEVTRQSVIRRIEPGAAFTREQYEDFTRLYCAYRPSHIGEGALAKLRQTPYPAGSPGEMTTDEPGTGYRDEIGIRAWAAQVWAITMDPRARVCMLLNADCSKNFPIHRFVAGRPGVIPKPWVYTQRTGDPQILPDPNRNEGIVVDVAHEPQFLFDAAILMAIERNAAKFAEYTDEMKWWIAFNHFNLAPNARQWDKGIFDVGIQQRGAAWAFRNVLMLAFVLEHYAPGDEWLPWLRTSIVENVRKLNGVYNTGDYVTDNFAPYYNYEVGAYRNVAGITTQANFAYGKGVDGITAVIAPWQQAFQASVVMWGSLINPSVPLYRELAQFMARFVVMLFGAPNDPARFDYRRNGNYNLLVGRFRAAQGVPATAAAPRAIDFFRDGRQFYVENGFKPLGPDDHQMRDGADIDRNFATRFDDMNVPALAMAVAIGAPGADEAFARLKSSAQYRIGGSIPFAYLPKGEHYDVDGPPAASAAPLAAFDLRRATKAADDGHTFTLEQPASVWYGANGRFVTVALPAGDYIASSRLFGADPIAGVAKAVYVMDPLVLAGHVAAPPRGAKRR